MESIRSGTGTLGTLLNRVCRAAPSVAGTEGFRGFLRWPHRGSGFDNLAVVYVLSFALLILFAAVFGYGFGQSLDGPTGLTVVLAIVGFAGIVAMAGWKQRLRNRR